MEEFNYEKDLEIDKYSLDFECLDQGRKFAKWARLLAQATLERDQAKQVLKIAKAKAQKDIRDDPEKFGLDKITDSIVNNAIETHADVLSAHDVYIQAEYNVNILESAREAFIDRSSRIKELIKLYLSGYWSEPKVKKEELEVLEKEGTKQQTRALNERMKERYKGFEK